MFLWLFLTTRIFLNRYMKAIFICKTFRPAPKRVEKVMGKYDFDGSDPDDLPFKKGELLTVVSKVSSEGINVRKWLASPRSTLS